MTKMTSYIGSYKVYEILGQKPKKKIPYKNSCVSAMLEEPLIRLPLTRTRLKCISGHVSIQVFQGKPLVKSFWASPPSSLSGQV